MLFTPVSARSIDNNNKARERFGAARKGSLLLSQNKNQECTSTYLYFTLSESNQAPVFF